MNSRMALRMITLAGLAALSTAACSSATTPTSLGSSGPRRLSSSAICASAGGTYSDGTCEPADDTRTAQQMCAAHNGTYFAGGDYCEFDGIWKP
jgi:exo-beta-1,3-glucanase (GH17 family)